LPNLEPAVPQDDETGLAKAQHALGRLTARERLDILLDAGSFEELAFEAINLDDMSIVAGNGTIHGRAVFVFAKDATVLSGALSAAHAEKIVQLQIRAIAAQAPLIGLYDSGGMRLEDGLASLAAYGEAIKHHVEASGVIPQIAVVMGPCIGADAFSASLSDFIFMVADTSALFVTGPEILHALTGEDLTAQALGGAAFHTEISGIADAGFEDDIAALSQVRRLIDFLPPSHQEPAPDWPSFDQDDRNTLSLDTLAPLDDAATPYDVKELILKIADEGDFFELRESFAQNIITGFARLLGRTVGLIANQPLVLGGVLDVNAMRKAARFMRFCERFNIPLITLVDVPGFLPGRDQEEHGIAQLGAKLLSAYAQASVPKITVILGQAYGAASLMMGAKSSGADLVLAWPSARLGLTKAGGAVLSADEARSQGFIDAVIAPHETRPRLIEALASLRAKPRLASVR